MIASFTPFVHVAKPFVTHKNAFEIALVRLRFALFWIIHTAPFNRFAAPLNHRGGGSTLLSVCHNEIL